MQRYWAPVLIVILIIVASAQLFSWRQAPGAYRRRPPGRAGNSTGFPAQQRLRGFAPSAGGSLSIQPESRFFPTLATQTGPLTVSVRHIRSLTDDRGLMRPAANEEGPMGPFDVYLQVLGNEFDLQRSHFDPSVAAVDDTGNRIQSQPGLGSPDGAVSFTGGVVYVVHFPAPDPHARALKRIDGRFHRWEPDGPAGDWDFHLTNVPLPNTPRLFGRAAPRLVSTDAAKGLPPGLVVVQGARAKELMRTSHAVTTPATMKPQRILLAPGYPASVGVPLPMDPARITLSARTEDTGFIHLDISSGTGRWSGSVWDSDLFVAVLPERSGIGHRDAMVFRLSRDIQQPDPHPVPAPTFTSLPGRPGGSIQTAVRIDGRPFSRGALSIELRAKEGTGWSDPRGTMVFLDADGVCVIPNLAAGEYQISRPGAQLMPPMIRLGPRLTLDAYLRNRYGINLASGTWQGEPTQPIVVREGQKTILPSLEWKPRTATTHLSDARRAVTPHRPAPERLNANL